MLVTKQNKMKLKEQDLKILTPKQMLQRLLIALAQVKPDNTLEDILKEIRKVAYSLYRANQITKKYTKI